MRPPRPARRILARALLGAAALLPPAHAADLDAVRARGSLVWAADQEGGGPHVYADPDDPARLRGFEVELAALVAAELGVEPRFQQGQWDRLPLLLGRSADCVINGFESTPERQRDWRCSRPYYAYALQLVARRDVALDSVEGLAGEGPAGPWRVGVLTGSAAEIEMRRRGDLRVEVVGFDGTVDCLEQVRSRVIDAALMDDCIAWFNADRFPAWRWRYRGCRPRRGPWRCRRWRSARNPSPPGGGRCPPSAPWPAGWRC